MDSLKIIISGGGTGGHIFPAVSIANAIKALEPDTDILFVGAEGRMEMQRVPDAGYPIKGLPVAGFDRKRLWRNFSVLWKLFKSQNMAAKIIRDFQPDAAVGVGGYASGPTLKVAQKAAVPTLIQEQNSYAGVTNKLLAKDANRICVAYDKMDRFFPADRIMLTGNPIRQALLNKPTQAEARESFGLDANTPTLVVIGGSLGARTLNEAMLAGMEQLADAGVQVIWQTGSYYAKEMEERMKGVTKKPRMYMGPFIKDMAAAYAAANLVVSRAGASSISEICLLGVPSILVPSPNVAEDHQTKNAMALVEKNAAAYVADADAVDTLASTALILLDDEAHLADMSTNVQKMAHPDAAEVIAKEVLALARAKK